MSDSQPSQPQEEEKGPSTREVIQHELKWRIQVYDAKSKIFQALLNELPENLSDDAQTALLHLLLKSKKDV